MGKRFRCAGISWVFDRASRLTVAVAMVALSAGCPGGPARVNVAGTVLGAGDVPVEGATVKIGKETVRTDAYGTFGVNGVATPYDVVVELVPASPADDTTAEAFLGLYSTAPMLRVNTHPSPQHCADIAGTVSGGARYPEPSGTDTSVSFRAAPDTSVSTAANTSTGAYQLHVCWYGGATLAGVVSAFQRTQTLDVTTFPGYGETNITLTDNIAASVDVLMSSGRETATLTGQVVVLGGSTVTRLTGWLLFDDRTRAFVSSTTHMDTMDYVLFDVPRGVAPAGVVCAEATTSGGKPASACSRAIPGSAESFDIPAPASPIAPVDGATEITSQSHFQWYGLPYELYAVRVHGYLGTTLCETFVVHTDGSAGEPLLGAIGLLPCGDHHTWEIVTGIGRIEDGMDYLVGPMSGPFLASTSVESSTLSFQVAASWQRTQPLNAALSMP